MCRFGTQPQRILLVLRRIKIIVRETSAIARCGITETSGYSQTNIRDYIVNFIIRIETNQTLIMTLLNTPEQPKIKAVAKMINGKWATFGFFPVKLDRQLGFWQFVIEHASSTVLLCQLDNVRNSELEKGRNSLQERQPSKMSTQN